MDQDYESTWSVGEAFRTCRAFKLGELVYVRSLVGKEWLGLVLARMRSGEYVVGGFPWKFAKGPAMAPRHRAIVGPAFLADVADA